MLGKKSKQWMENICGGSGIFANSFIQKGTSFFIRKGLGKASGLVAEESEMGQMEV